MEITDPSKERLQLLLHLPPTEQIEKEADGSRGKLERLEWGKTRDAIQTGRPIGCTCLGLGWLKEKTFGDGEVAKLYCACEAGKEAKITDVQAAIKHTRELRLYCLDDSWVVIPSRFTQWRLHTSPLAISHAKLLKHLHYPGGDSAALALLNNEGHILYQNIPFDGYETNQARIKDWMRSWYFWGPYGVGKTGLAIGYAYEYLLHNVAGLHYITVPDLLSRLRSTYNRHEGPTEQEILDSYMEIDLLIIDDMGAEQISGTGWVEDRLYQIIGNRHAEERATVFTSNLGLEELAHRIGERITWRIVEMCGADHIIKIDGPNLRDIKGKKG